MNKRFNIVDGMTVEQRILKHAAKIKNMGPYPAAALIGCTVPTFMAAAKRLGVEYKQRVKAGTRDWDSEARAQGYRDWRQMLTDLYRIKKKTIREIADLMKCRNEVIAGFIKEFGIQKRKSVYVPPKHLEGEKVYNNICACGALTGVNLRTCPACVRKRSE